MNLKQVGETVRRSCDLLAGRAAGAVRPLIAFRVALAVLAWPNSLAAQPAAASPSPADDARISRAVAMAIELEFSDVFRGQAQSGAYALQRPAPGYAAYPLMATMSWDAYRATGSTAALSQAAYSIARYYSHLFASADRDGNRLIETPAPWGGAGARVEDPGFNALLAVDALCVARINLELRRTMPALYWYDDSRAIARAVIAHTFDPETNYFFPLDAATGRMRRHMSAVASMPASFDGLVGGNHLLLVANRHVAPWAADLVRAPAGADVATRNAERLVAVDVLRDAGRRDAIGELRALDLLGASTGDIFALYAAERATIDRSILDRELALDIFLSIVRSSGRFSDGDLIRLDTALAEVKSLAGRPDAPHSLDNGERAVRDTYTAVSQLRDRMASSTFWSEEQRRLYPGQDPTLAAQRLTEDVLRTVRRAENRLFEMRYGAVGLRVATTLSANSAVGGEDVSMRWELTSETRTFVFKTLRSGVVGESLLPVVAPGGLEASPGGPPIRFASRHTLAGAAHTMRPITFALAVEDESGGRARYYVERSVFVRPPISVVARFPRGRIIDGTRVPIELTFLRHSRTSGTAQYFWFSPSGLRLAEGNQGRVQFSATDSVTATLNVEIPSPCRPGVFPFTLKVYSNDRDAGTISATFYKPYQWTAVGPFPASGGLNGKLPPENGVGLLQSYAGAESMIKWKPVPRSASGPGGEVGMRGVIPGRGVSYLYTVVACAYETAIEARLSANCPAALFVNGRRMLTVNGDSASTVIHLGADRNQVMIKLLGDSTSVVSFSLGNNDKLAADEFNNDLIELAEGYRELVARASFPPGSEPGTHRLVTFRIEDPTAASVSVVGSFNGWSPQVHRLQKRDSRTWEITLSLAPGRYGYRFLIDQKKQVLDPSTPLTEPDGFGGRNSVVIVSR